MRGVPLLSFEEGPGVPLLNFEEGPGVLLLNFKGGPGSWDLPRKKKLLSNFQLDFY